MQQHTESAHKTCIPETTTRANAKTHLTTQTLRPPRIPKKKDHLGPPNQNGKTLDNQCGKNGPQAHVENPGEHTARIDPNP